MLAPSDTANTPFATSAFASSPLISFCVAEGRAMSAFSFQGRAPATYLQPYFSAYSRIRPR